MRKFYFRGEIVEEVTVNDMTMYKWGSELFVSQRQVEKAISYMIYGDGGLYNSDRSKYGYKDFSVPFEVLARDGILRGIKL